MQSLISLSHMVSPFISPLSPLPWKRPPLLIQLYCRKYLQNINDEIQKQIKKHPWAVRFTAGVVSTLLSMIPDQLLQTLQGPLVRLLSTYNVLPSGTSIEDLNLSKMLKSIVENHQLIHNMFVTAASLCPLRDAVPFRQLNPGKQYLVKKTGEREPLAVVRLSGKPKQGGGYTYKWERPDMTQQFQILEVLYVTGDLHKFMKTFNCHVLKTGTEKRERFVIYEHMGSPEDPDESLDEPIIESETTLDNSRTEYPPHRQELIDLDVYALRKQIQHINSDVLLGSFISAANNEVHICTSHRFKKHSMFKREEVFDIEVDSALEFYNMMDAEVDRLDREHYHLFTTILSIPTSTTAVHATGKTHTLFTLLSGFTKSFGIELVKKSAPAPTGGGGARFLSSASAGGT